MNLRARILLLLLMLACIMPPLTSKVDVSTSVHPQDPFQVAAIAPLLSSPPDVTDYELNTTGNIISWECESADPDALTLYLDGSPKETRSAWSNGTQAFGIDYLPRPATYNFTLLATEGGGLSSSDTVLVTVIDTTSPTVQGQGHIYAAAGSATNITWDCWDANPKRLMIVQNTSVIRSEDWAGGNVTHSLQSLGIGYYEFSLYLWDNASIPNQASTTTPVTIFSPSLPFIYPGNTSIMLDENVTGTSVQWSTSDDNPDIYEVYVDDILVVYSFWSGVSVSYNADLLSYRMSPYNVTLVVIDDDTNVAKNTVWVSIVDTTPPDIVDLAPFAIEVVSVTEVRWTVHELHPSAYAIFIDTELAVSSPWTGDDITYSFSSSELGLYEVMLSLVDLSDNVRNTSVDISVVDSVAPVIAGPDEVIFALGSMHDINFTITDALPAEYQVYENGTLQESGSIAGSSVTYSIFSLVRGFVNLTLVVNDTSGHDASFSTAVWFIDSYLPVITGAGEAYLNLTETDTITLQWQPSDQYPASYQIYVNSLPIYDTPQPWNGSSIRYEYSIDSEGVYNFTLQVFDEDGNTAAFSTFVTAEASSGSTTGTASGTTAPTTDPTDPPLFLSPEFLLATIAIMGLVVGVVALKRRKQEVHSGISTSRGVNLKGGVYTYIVKVMNTSRQTITDVKITLVSFPSDSMKCEDLAPREFKKIEKDAFETASWKLKPIQDCVKGEVKAHVLYLDAYGAVQNEAVEPYTLKAVCPLLKPKPVDRLDWAEMELQGFQQDESSIDMGHITIIKAQEVVEQLIASSNFQYIASRVADTGMEVWGWAEGEFSGEDIGLVVTIGADKSSSSLQAKILVASPIQEMLPIALEELQMGLQKMLLALK